MATKQKATPMPASGGGGSGGRPTGAATGAAESPLGGVQAHAKWADNHLGRGGALAANGVFAVTSGATKVVGWSVGDPNLHIRSGLRSLIPMHLRVSARVHHVAFFHPSLDVEIAAPVNSSSKSGGRGGGGKRDKVGSAIKKTFGWEEHAGGDDEGDMAKLVAVLDSEQRRLSRDGIVEQHMSRALAKRRSQSNRSVKISGAVVAGKDDEEGIGLSAGKGARRFVVASRIPQSAESKRTDDAPEFFRHVLKKGKGEVDVLRTAAGLSDESAKQEKYLAGIRTAKHNSSGVENPLNAIRTRASDSEDADDGTIAFDEDGVAGDGPILASLIKQTYAAKVGRFLPQVACRVPSSSVGFELRNDQRRVQSTQPFVVEAPHVIWGGGRDRMFCRVAADGNPLIDARALEYLSNNELDLAERTESLLCTSATVWVDIPEEVKKDAKSAKDVAKHAAKTMEKAVIKTAEAGSKGVDKIEKGLVKTAASGSKGAKKIRKVFFSHRNKRAKGANEEERKKDKGSADQPDAVCASGEDDESETEGRPSLERVEGKICLTGRKTVIDPQEMTRDAIETKASDEGNTHVVEEESEALADLLSRPAPYVLVLDDVLDFRVVDFPTSDVMATFPISVASVLNNRNVEDRFDNPLRPSELTVTLVQEPSFKENRWGVEVKVTFRVAEVKPDTPLALEKPELDDKGRWSKSNVDKKLQRLGIHLKNIGRSKEEIDREIKAAKEMEEAEEEALEAAIVAAGVGKGYEHGAPWKEIVRRQMFYDPEREAISSHRQYGSKDLQTGILKRIGLHSVRPVYGDGDDKKEMSHFGRSGLDQKIPSQIFATDIEGGARQSEGAGLLTFVPESLNIATGSDMVSSSSSEPQASEIVSVAEGGVLASSTRCVPSMTSGESQLFMSTRERAPSDNENAAPISEGIMPMSAEGNAFASARESSSSVQGANSLSCSASKLLRVTAVDQDSHQDVNVSTFLSSSDSTKQSAPFLSAAQSIKPDSDNMDVLHSTMLTPEVDKKATEKVTCREANVTGRSVSIEHDFMSIEARTNAPGGEGSPSVIHQGQIKLSTKNLKEETLLSAVEPPVQTEAVLESRSPHHLARRLEPVSTMDTFFETSLKDDVGSNIAHDRKLSGSQSKKNRRSSVQSLALMQLSLGGLKGLIGEDDLDILRQIESLGENRSSEIPGKGMEESSGRDVVALTFDRRPIEILASWAFAFTERCKHMFLEEYPGLLLGLSAVVFVLAIRWTFFSIA